MLPLMKKEKLAKKSKKLLRFTTNRIKLFIIFYSMSNLTSINNSLVFYKSSFLSIFNYSN